ncbi:hypothetical protein J2S19_003847 [Metabacillus malikii]|uniref:Uncharacterized protein n=1 Tax=Metabacillus malikii TaxID=1504265 RepID=A0ABT9ZJQ2_9BACI|nr:hypothetical protein [Metabacillus malikii]
MPQGAMKLTTPRKASTVAETKPEQTNQLKATMFTKTPFY